MSNISAYVRCLPSPQDCLIPNERSYPNDKRIDELKKILSNESPVICIVGIEEDKILSLYRDMMALCAELDEKWLESECLVSIVEYKPIFWFKNMGSFHIFKDVYTSETNELIIEQYNRIFGCYSGNNLCISLDNFLGMICRLPYDMSDVAKRGKEEGYHFQ